MAKDYYAVLGLQKGASSEDVKKAYRRLSKELHPDKHPSTGSGRTKEEAEQKFKEVNEAYAVLSDPKKKQAYDQFGEAGVNGGAGGFSGSGPFGSAQGGGFGGFDFSQFGGDAGSFSDLFEGFFGGRSRAGGAERAQGRDVEAEIIIELKDAVSGMRRTLQVRTFVRCSHCDGNGAEPKSKIVTCAECGGTGQVTRTVQSFFGTMRQTAVCPRCRGAGKVPETACKKCDGEGRVSATETVHVDVPAGIQDGQTLRLRGKGEAGRRGAATGDFFVRIRVREDPRFRRDGDDIRTQMDVSVLDAMLGATTEVATVHGPVSLKIPEGTQPGQVLRIKGKGMPVLSSSRMGDHYVTVNVLIPTKLSKEERRLLEEWKRLKS